MLSKLNIIIILLFIPSVLYADEWTYADITMEVLYTGLLVADWNQTLQIKDHDNLYEANKFLGKHPGDNEINLYFAVTLIGHYYIAKKLNQPYRALWQMVFISTRYNIVNRNRQKGLLVNFNF